MSEIKSNSKELGRNLTDFNFGASKKRAPLQTTS